MSKKLLIVLCIAAGLLTGCGKEDITPVDHPLESSKPPVESQTANQEESSVPETETEESTEPPEETPKTITDRPVVDGKKQSYLTGEWKDAEIVDRRSMAVMIPNNKPALPQYGLSRASIIYEAPVEGRITRLMAFFEDYDDLEFIGPVRSSRDYFVYEAMAYDAIYCNWGLARPFVEELINSDRIDNVSQAVAGIYNPASEAYDRRTRAGYADEFRGYLFIKGYNKAVERLGYEKNYRSTFEQAFTFAADGYPATYDDNLTVTKIYPGGTSSNSGGYGNAKPYFVYNEEDHLYYRYEYGDKQIDEMNNEQLKVSNVVFKLCHGEVREPAEKDYLAFGVHGTGKAVVFTRGKVIEGTWSRDGDENANYFYDNDGNEIIFNQGKTWICNIWEEYSQYISYE